MPKRPTPYKVGPFLVTPRASSLLVRGEGLKFTLREESPSRWRVTSTFSDGARHRERFNAETLEDALTEAVSRIIGDTTHGHASEIRIGDLLAKWLDSLSVRPETLKGYKGWLVAFIQWTGENRLYYWADVRLGHLQEYARYLREQQYAEPSIHHYIRSVLAASKWASLNWPETFRYLDGFRMPRDTGPIKFDSEKTRVFLTFEEVTDFLGFLERVCPRLMLPVALQALVGLRLTETLRLTWPSVDLTAGTLTVEGEVKNPGSVRRIPLPLIVQDLLWETRRTNSRVVPWADRGLYGYDLRAAFKAWGRPRAIEPRGLRRTIPSEAMLGGWGGYAVERFLGHAPKTVTEAHYSPTGDQLLAMQRDHVVAKIDQATALFRQKRHEKGHDPNILELRGAR